MNFYKIVFLMRTLWIFFINFFILWYLLNWQTFSSCPTSALALRKFFKIIIVEDFMFMGPSLKSQINAELILGKWNNFWAKVLSVFASGELKCFTLTKKVLYIWTKMFYIFTHSFIDTGRLHFNDCSQERILDVSFLGKLDF